MFDVLSGNFIQLFLEYFMTYAKLNDLHLIEAAKSLRPIRSKHSGPLKFVLRPSVGILATAGSNRTQLAFQPKQVKIS